MGAKTLQKGVPTTDRLALSVVYGPPLAGKSTFVEQHQDTLHHISLGRLCREEAKRDTPQGAALRESIENNTFLPSDMLLSLALTPGNLHPTKENVLDGYPKYAHEVEPLADFCDAGGLELKNLYLVNPPLPVLLGRLAGRFTCDPCYKPMQAGEACDCGRGGTPFVREEDTEAYFQQRYDRFAIHSPDVIQALGAHCQEVIDVQNY